MKIKTDTEKLICVHKKLNYMISNILVDWGLKMSRTEKTDIISIKYICGNMKYKIHMPFDLDTDAREVGNVIFIIRNYRIKYFYAAIPDFSNFNYASNTKD